MTASSWLLVAFPALGALVLLLMGKHAKDWGHLLGCATVTLAFVYG
ncbi:MAG: NADH-quinone oxidoreductase subunit, partial [Pseudonocardia sp.]